MEWCELEKLHPLGMEMEVVRPAVGCFALEMQMLGLLGKNLCVDDYSNFRDFIGSSACIMSRDA